MGESSWLKQHIKTILWVAPRLLILLVVVGATWFFLFRSASQESQITAPKVGNSETKVSSEAPDTAAPKTSGDAASGKSSDTSSGTGKDMPNTGPNDTLAIFLAATFAGILFWELRLRRLSK